MAKTFMITTQEDVDELKNIIQEQFDKGRGIAMATAVRQLKFVKSRNVYDVTTSFAPDTFGDDKKGFLPKTALSFGVDNDLIVGIWASKSIKQEAQ